MYDSTKGPGLCMKSIVRMFSTKKCTFWMGIHKIREEFTRIDTEFD